MRYFHQTVTWLILSLLIPKMAEAQSSRSPGQGAPGDLQIHRYLADLSNACHETFGQDIQSLEAWQSQREQYRREYFYMLGLSPMPPRTPLQAEITGTITRDGYQVDNLHYQSRPGLYVTGNLYRPTNVPPGTRLPAVLYVCGHASRGRNGNKTAYQSHGIWLAKHGYICLMVDTLQLGEIAAIHHGTYREQRWWWISRGYTSAGVECWNGIRGIDYLISREDVDADRIGVTGISGGGAATFWVAAADERVRVAVPVSGMADLPSYVNDRIINGHCDCMFLYNTYRWPWTRIAGLIAPRPLLFVNSDQDPIFPMDANERVIQRLEMLYRLYGAGDRVDAVVSVGGHAYREDIRKATFRFLNIHLKEDASPIKDSEEDLVTLVQSQRQHPIDPEQLRVFPTDQDIPRDERNTSIDQSFVPLATVSLPTSSKDFKTWKQSILGRLKHVALRYLPDRVPAATPVPTRSEHFLRTEPHIEIRSRPCTAMKQRPNRIMILIQSADATATVPSWLDPRLQPGDFVANCETRGTASTQWTTKNPPNYVERSHLLVGHTVDAGRLRDVIATVRYWHDRYKGNVPVHVVGAQRDAILAAYAALLEPTIQGAILHQPPQSHMQATAPQFLNVLRVCDIPHILGMVAPRPLVISGVKATEFSTVSQLYRVAGAADRLTLSQ